MTSGAVGWSAPHVAAAYAETFAHLCAGSLADVLEESRVGDASVRRVLDVGAGTGALAALVSEAGRRVTAVDPDPEMVRLARETGPDLPLLRAALPHLPFRDRSFDAVLANFVINHLPDPRAGMRELVRVAATGGRVVTTIWPSGQDAQSRLWAEVVDTSGAVVPPSVRLPPAKDFPRTPEGLAALLHGSGLTDVRVRRLGWTHRAEPDSLWRGAASGVGGIGRTVTSQDADVRARMKAEYDRLVVDLTRDGVVELPAQALLAVGTRPRA